jgi:hypothetical protein
VAEKDTSNPINMTTTRICKTDNLKKFSILYATAAAVYYLFDFVYMPWLSYKFGNMIFLPLYPSILLVNAAGVYAYNCCGEDVLFIELGKGWLADERGRFKTLKRIVNKRKSLTFVVLSIYPSPIASYLFFKDESAETPAQIVRVIAVGSVFCTLFWGGGISLIRLLLAGIISLM